MVCAKYIKVCKLSGRKIRQTIKNRSSKILHAEDAVKRSELSYNDHKDTKDFLRGGDDYFSGDEIILKEKIQYEVDYYDAVQNLPPATKLKVPRWQMDMYPARISLWMGLLSCTIHLITRTRRSIWRA